MRRLAILLRNRRGAADTAPDSAARGYVESHFVWCSSGRKLEQVIDSVVKPHRETVLREA